MVRLPTHTVALLPPLLLLPALLLNRSPSPTAELAASLLNGCWRAGWPAIEKLLLLVACMRLLSGARVVPDHCSGSSALAWSPAVS